MRRFDVVIVGAGMIGLAVAAHLARTRRADALRITVLDGGPRPAFDAQEDVGLRVSAVSTGSAAYLDGLGAWQPVIGTRAGAFEGMRVWDANSRAESSDALCFEAADFGLPVLGHIVENALLRHALLDTISGSDVDLRFATQIERVRPRSDGDGFDVVLGGGETLRPQLLIGADGADSLVRKQARIPVRAWQYPQAAFVTHARPELPHRHVAWQRFLKSGPIALLPLGDGRVSVVWSTTPERAREASGADADSLGKQLTEASDGVLGALSVNGPCGSFPLRAQHATRYTEAGLALVGDAAHAVHPLAGQGANLGFADAAELCQTLIAALDRDEYPGDLPTLRRYERARRGANAAMLHFIDSINRLFMADRGFFVDLRRRGMRVFNRSGPVRRKAVEVALGLHLRSR
ncbi:MAG: FAD-dependent oxidoreductase [Woeseiaceae bacterium]|nr:FAD-dependent oxidoreductase [Woeseiaceae bacterium]